MTVIVRTRLRSPAKQTAKASPVRGSSGYVARDQPLGLWLPVHPVRCRTWLLRVVRAFTDQHVPDRAIAGSRSIRCAAGSSIATGCKHEGLWTAWIAAADGRRSGRHWGPPNAVDAPNRAANKRGWAPAQ